MKDLFENSRQECMELAKRNIVDNIYSSARIEGIAITFPETQELYEGRAVAGLSVEDIVKVNNLKHAWQFVFDSIDYPLDLLYLKQLNQYINAGIRSDAGKLRNYAVSIGGTSWKPEMPDSETIKGELQEIMGDGAISHTERAVRIMLYVMRTQMFSDGNKRVAQLAANQILIQNGRGLLRIPPEQKAEFGELLIKYYETGERQEISDFLYRTSIQGKREERVQEEEPVCPEMFIRHKKSGAR